MEATDASIRQELEGIQLAFLDAYDSSEEQLVQFMKSWEDLKNRLIEAASARLLSPQTLTVAANVAKSVAAISASLLALHETKDKLKVDLVQDTSNIIANPASYSASPDDSDSEAPSSPPTSEIFPTNSSDSELDEEDEDASQTPRYDVLKDWFFSNIGHPFASHSASDHTELLSRANASYEQFVDWLAFVRKRSGWARLFRLHAQESAHWMEKFCFGVIDELDRGVSTHRSAFSPTIRKDFRQLRLEVERAYNFKLSQWWDGVHDIMETVGITPWEQQQIEYEEWSSDGYISPNDSIASSDSELASKPEFLEKLASRQTSPRPVQIGSCAKRKATELDEAESTASQDLLLPHERTEGVRSKRRKVQHSTSPFRPHFSGTPASDYSGSSHYASTPASTQSIVHRTSLTDVPKASSPSAESSTSKRQISIGSPDNLLSSFAAQPSTLKAASQVSKSNPPEIVSPIPISFPQMQIQTDRGPQAQFIRSNSKSHTRKRKHEGPGEKDSVALLEPTSREPQIRTITHRSSRTNRLHNRYRIVDLPAPARNIQSDDPTDQRSSKRQRVGRVDSSRIPLFTDASDSLSPSLSKHPPFCSSSIINQENWSSGSHDRNLGLQPVLDGKETVASSNDMPPANVFEKQKANSHDRARVSDPTGINVYSWLQLAELSAASEQDSRSELAIPGIPSSLRFESPMSQFTSANEPISAVLVHEAYRTLDVPTPQLDFPSPASTNLGSTSDVRTPATIHDGGFSINSVSEIDKIIGEILGPPTACPMSSDGSYPASQSLSLDDPELVYQS